jgi:hypothetical protein
MSHDCGSSLQRRMLEEGDVEAVVSATALPIVENPYGGWIVCPHGTAYYVEPTGEQVMRWNRAAP